eukprot:932804-Amphidinium_carterae.1
MYDLSSCRQGVWLVHSEHPPARRAGVTFQELVRVTRSLATSHFLRDLGGNTLVVESRWQPFEQAESSLASTSSHKRRHYYTLAVIDSKNGRGQVSLAKLALRQHQTLDLCTMFPPQ